MAVGNGTCIETAKRTHHIVGGIGHLRILNREIINRTGIIAEEAASVRCGTGDTLHGMATAVEVTKERLLGRTDTTRPTGGIEIQFEERFRSARIYGNTRKQISRFSRPEVFVVSLIIKRNTLIHILGEKIQFRLVFDNTR